MMSAIFPDFQHPLPRVGSFLVYTIRRQFGPIFDPSPPPNCRRNLPETFYRRVDIHFIRCKSIN